MPTYEIRYCKVRARRGIKPWGVFRIDQEPGLALGLTQHWTEADAQAAMAKLQALETEGEG